ncbi:MAG TPA: glycoside hydrolase family 3 N-terminal domain-containing protein [Candidatus Acidoferrales bacterium]|nr:glycoside hydrolase family 3 N-terminal domain-containing protein [Candidatus Acidoferrales bacterium]
MLAKWTVDQLAEQVVAVPVLETDVGTVQAEVGQGVGGILLYGSDAPTDLGVQLKSLEASAPGGIVPLVMTDEEGGGVQRMANLVGSLPWAREMGSTMSPAEIESLAESTGQAMLQQGVTMDLAPVLDVDGGVGPNAVDPDGSRSFSPDPTVASNDGVAFAEGLIGAGVIPVVKHFPGLGGASANTDDGPASTLPYSTLQGAGLRPFEAAVNAGLPAVMVSDASIPGITTLPASLSSAAIEGLLEGQLHFHGLILTDSLSAGAITALGLGVAQATVESIAAGSDMVMFSSGDPAQVTAAIDAAMVVAVTDGQVSTSRLVDAVSQVLAAKDVDLCSKAALAQPRWSEAIERTRGIIPND